jgi:hypothetical protein
MSVVLESNGWGCIGKERGRGEGEGAKEREREERERERELVGQCLYMYPRELVTHERCSFLVLTLQTSQLGMITVNGGIYKSIDILHK